MAILTSLGINHTILFQFVIFVLTFIILSQIVFKPYMDAMLEREKRTKGGEELANELLKQVGDLKTQYEEKVRTVTSQIKGIFDAKRADGSAEFDRIVNLARQESQTIIENSRANIQTELTKASKDLQTATPDVANVIAQKLLKNG